MSSLKHHLTKEEVAIGPGGESSRPVRSLTSRAAAHHGFQSTVDSLSDSSTTAPTDCTASPSEGSLRFMSYSLKMYLE